MKALIIGSGIGGICAALALRNLVFRILPERIREQRLARVIGYEV
jgi:hypothetical protein